MNFLESTNFFVRVTVYDYCHRLPEKRLKFRLIPMVHIGEPQFYDLAKEKIMECDELLYEGLRGGSNIQLFNSREVLGKQLGLVLQREALKINREEIKMTHADYTAEEYQSEWEKVSWLEKVKERITRPVKRLHLARNITRFDLAKYFMTSYEEAHLAYRPSYDEPGTTENFYYAGREQKVFQIIEERMATESNDDKLIGVLYGAGHMNRISRNIIDRYGYHVCQGEFLKVFDVN
ncbi:MAG: hypothetical protein AB8G22_13780 [Saprospiraceae bacterium]